MDKQKFLDFYKGNQTIQTQAGFVFDLMKQTLNDYGIYSDNTLIGLLATIRCEVGRDYMPKSERTDGKYLEMRTDLGNNCIGDGFKYRGRGFIQLTGKSNYEQYGKQLNIDLINNPDLANDTSVAVKIAVLYFKNRGIKPFCDSENWYKVRYLVNGGYNGMADFTKIINQFLSISGNTEAQTAFSDSPVVDKPDTNILNSMKGYKTYTGIAIMTIMYFLQATGHSDITNSDQLNQIVNSGMDIFGILMAIYGRYMATKNN